MLLHLPTGSGKTIIATLIIERLLPLIQSAKILFIAHRKELLDQTVLKLKQHLPRLSVSVEQGKSHASKDAQVIVASIQSLIQRIESYQPEQFSLIICDECHHALAPSWTEVIQYFHDRCTQDSLLLGMTATPRRTDGRSVLRIFDRVAYEISKPELQDLGYLVPIRYWAVKASLSLDKVKMSSGDFQVGALSRVMNTPRIRALTIKAWQEKGGGQKTLVFCASVQHAYQLASDFSGLGFRAEVIEGRTKNREQILDRFRRDELDLLLNYGVLTEGFDDPSIECILLARPTTSPLVYNQCLGRGLRPAPRKTHCTVIDIIDRSTHQLQYGAGQLVDLPRGWSSKGRDPFRESRAISQIQVTDPSAFLELKKAQCLEELQDLLMELPPDIVIAGLDGEPVPHYTPVREAYSEEEAKKIALKLLRKAKAPVAQTIVTDPQARQFQISLHLPEVNNEAYAYLAWHIERATGWQIEYTPPKKRSGRKNPKALLRSMIPKEHRITKFNYDQPGNRIVAEVPGLNSEALDEIRVIFEASSGIELDLQGQLSFGFF